MMSELKKEPRQIDVWGLAFGAIIGTGCFFLPGTKFLPLSGPLGMVIGILIGTVMILIIGINYSYLIQQFPQAGGEYIFVRKNLGKSHAFLCGWFLLLAYILLVPLNSTSVSMILRYLTPGLLEKGKIYNVAGWDVYPAEILVTSLIIVILTWINVVGVKFAGYIQTVLALILAVCVFVGAVAAAISGVTISNLQPAFAGENKIECVLATLAISPFLFIGFDCIPQASEEYKFPHSKTLKIMFLAIIFAALTYITVALLTGVVMPWREMLNQNHSWVTGAAIEYKFGKPGILLLGTAMICSSLAGINAFLLSSARLLYAMAGDKVIPPVLGKVDSKQHIPVNAIVSVAVISLIAPWFGREVLNWIVEMSSVGGALVYGYSSFITFIIAKQKKSKKYGLCGIAGTIFSVCFLVLLLFPGLSSSLSREALIALVIWNLLGILIWFWVKGT